VGSPTAAAERRREARYRIGTAEYSEPPVAEGSLPRDATLRGTGPLRTSAARLFVVRWALPVTVVLVFVHVRFRPKVTRGLVSVDIADVAVLCVLAVAFAAGRQDGFAVLRRSRWVWLTLALFLFFVLAACFYPLIHDSAYHWRKHVVTWGKLLEFSLVGAAAAVLLSVRGILGRLLVAVVGVATVAGLVAVVQFAGARILLSWTPGGRQASFTGIEELAALGGITLAIAFSGLLDGDVVDRRLVKPAIAAGTVCLVFSGAVAGGVGLGAAAVVALCLGRVRSRLPRLGAVAIVATVAVCALGLLALRGGDIAQFARYVGLAKKERSTTTQVQTYSQRVLQLYLGVRIWEDHPLFGAGWASVREQQVYSPYLADAHRRFPDQPPRAFPSPEHPWGIDNAYVEVLAETGAVGALLFLAALLTGLWSGVVATLRAPPLPAGVAQLGVLWLLVTLGIWLGQGLVITGVTDTAWFALGLIGFGWASRSQRPVSGTPLPWRR